MIDSIKDLNLPTEEDFHKALANNDEASFWNKIDEAIKEKLGISCEELVIPIVEYLKTHSEELSLQFPNIAPLGDYSKLIEDNDGMSDFLKTEAAKIEHWQLVSLSEDEKFNLVKFVFKCNAVDEGESLNGFALVSKSGKLKHAFAQYVG